MFLVRRTVVATLGILGFLAWAGDARAQSAPPDEVQSLKAEIAALRDSMRQQQSKLDALEQKLDAQSSPPATAAQVPVEDAVESSPSKPVEISGYLSSRFTHIAGLGDSATFGQQTISLFFDKSLGRLELHSEMEYEYSPETDFLGRPSGPSSGDFSAETAWLDYHYRDSLNARAGIFLTPTYWALHHYPSTSLTVENPLIHERIFPANVIGGMAHGSHFFEDGGFDYSLYGGEGAKYSQPATVAQAGSDAVGGTFRVHVPTSHLFRVFDIGTQVYRDKPAAASKQNIYGFESEIEKGPLAIIGEFAHANVYGQNGLRDLFREGYYLQPSWRLGKGFTGYYRYDRFKFDSSIDGDPFGAQHTAGVNFRPIPVVSLKLEWNEAFDLEHSNGWRQGFGAGLAYFFQ